MNELISKELVTQIKALLETSRQKIAVEVNTTLLQTYWQIGRLIVEEEKAHIGNEEYKNNRFVSSPKSLQVNLARDFPVQIFQT